MRTTFLWLIRWAVLTAFLWMPIFAHAQSTIPVTGHVGGADNTVPPGIGVKFELYNCGGNLPRVPGSFSIAKQTFTLTPDSTGLLTGTIFPNDIIVCGGVTGSTRYKVTVLFNNIPQGLATCYWVLSTTSPFNLDAATPCTTVPQAPPYVFPTSSALRYLFAVRPDKET